MRTIGFIALILISGLISCNTAVEKPTQNTTPVQPDKVINLSEANSMVQDYLTKMNLSWGEPEFIRNAPGKYIFSFKTPSAESSSHGPRILTVEIRTGKVSSPVISGRKFTSNSKK